MSGTFSQSVHALVLFLNRLRIPWSFNSRWLELVDMFVSLHTSGLTGIIDIENSARWRAHFGGCRLLASTTTPSVLSSPDDHMFDTEDTCELLCQVSSISFL